MAIPTFIRELGQAIFAVVLSATPWAALYAAMWVSVYAVTLSAILHFTAPRDSARVSHIREVSR